MLLLESALLLSKSTHDCRQPSHSQVQYQCTCITWKAQHSKTTRKVNPSWPNTNLNKLIQNLWYQLYPFVTPKVPINFNRYVYCPMMEPQLLDHTPPNSAWWANIMPLVAGCHQSFLVTGFLLSPSEPLRLLLCLPPGQQCHQPDMLAFAWLSE